jgi:5'-deoxynucleotidase YfbR-like HD superfamily hydrolase
MNTTTQLQPTTNRINTIHGAAVQVGIEQLKAIYQQFKDAPELHMEFDMDEIQHVFKFDLLKRNQGSSISDWILVYGSNDICLDDHSAIEQLQEVITEANKLLGLNVVPFTKQEQDFNQLGNPISKHAVLPPVVQTHSGIMFNLLAPERSTINIEDIAHALSNLCRFNGHSTQFYSVAQHSVLVSRLVPPYLALPALMHDSAEAYLGDCVSPLKQLLPEYKQIENNIMQAIFNCIGLPYPLHSEIKRADIRALATEQRDLMNACEDGWHWQVTQGISPSDVQIFPESPEEAKDNFLKRYFELQANLLAMA